MTVSPASSHPLAGYRFSNGDTPLHHAIETSNLPLLKRVIEAGFPLEERNAFNLTPFQLAVSQKKIDMAEQIARHLIESEFSLENRPAIEQQLSLFKQQKSFYQSQTRLSETTPPLHLAAAVGDLKSLRDAYPASLHIPDRDGRTPLEYAIIFGQTNAAAFLIEHGFSPDLTVGLAALNQKASLYLAALFNRVEIFKSLLDKGLDPNLPNYAGWTPAQCFAASCDSLESLLAIKEMGASLSTPSNMSPAAIFLIRQFPPASLVSMADAVLAGTNAVKLALLYCFYSLASQENPGWGTYGLNSLLIPALAATYLFQQTQIFSLCPEHLREETKSHTHPGSIVSSGISSSVSSFLLPTGWSWIFVAPGVSTYAIGRSCLSKIKTACSQIFNRPAAALGATALHLFNGAAVAGDVYHAYRFLNWVRTNPLIQAPYREKLRSETCDFKAGAPIDAGIVQRAKFCAAPPGEHFNEWLYSSHPKEYLAKITETFSRSEDVADCKPLSTMALSIRIFPAGRGKSAIRMISIFGRK